MSNNEAMERWKARAEHYGVPAPTRLATCVHGPELTATSLALEILIKVAPTCSSATLSATALTALAWEYMEKRDRVAELEDNARGEAKS